MIVLSFLTNTGTQPRSNTFLFEIDIVIIIVLEKTFAAHVLRPVPIDC